MPKKITLLEQILENSTVNFSEEELEVVEAWLDNKISITDVINAFGVKTSSSAYVILARGAREIYNRNKDE